MGWLSGWQYRKSHAINSASGAGTNYQVKIITHYGSGTDSGADVYLNNHCRTDFGDVRFTDDDGVTQLDYWMEEKVDGDYAVFWVEVADDLSSANATIYVYYGKSDATTTSDASSTFICGTDFDKDDGFLIRDNGVDESFGDQTGEVRTGGTNQELYFSGDRTHQNWVKKQLASTLTQNFAVRIKLKFDAGTGSGNVDHPLCSIESGDYPQNNANNYLLSITWLRAENKLIIREFRGTTYTGSSGITLSLNTWYVAEMRVPGTTATLVVGASSDTKTVTLDNRNWFKPLNYISGWSSQTNTHHLAFAVLRKYVDPEPSHGSWGSEEQAGGGVTYEIYVDAISRSLATPTYETTYNVAKDASVAGQTLTTSETTFNLIEDAVVKTLAVVLVELIHAGIYEIFMDASVQVSAIISTENLFNLVKDAIAQAAATPQIIGIHQISKDAIADASTTPNLQQILGISKEALAFSVSTPLIQSKFGISPEATVKVLAEFTLIKPTEVKITKLFLILGDLAIQIQGG